MKKYTTVKISGVITSIALMTDTEGYTEDIIQTVFPENAEHLTPNEVELWVEQNNQRMKAICDMLNKDKGVQECDTSKAENRTKS